MDVRMVGQRAAPGVQDTEDPDEPPDLMWVFGERDERLGGGAEQDVIQVFLVAADQLPQLLGQGEDDVKIGDREPFPAPVCQPSVGVKAMTLGGSCGCGRSGRHRVPDHRARLAAAVRQRLGPAGEESLHGPAMAGQQVLPKPVQVFAAVPPQDVRHLWHDRAPAPLEISHEGGDGGVHHVQGRGRQRRVAGGGPGALVAQQFLNDP